MSAYTQENGRRESVSQSFRTCIGKNSFGVYVITPASGGNNLLDIYHCSEIFRPWYEKEDLLIVGIALGYDDACLLAGQIVNEVYRATGGFDVKQYLLKNVR